MMLLLNSLVQIRVMQIRSLEPIILRRSLICAWNYNREGADINSYAVAPCKAKVVCRFQFFPPFWCPTCSRTHLSGWARGGGGRSTPTRKLECESEIAKKGDASILIIQTTSPLRIMSSCQDGGQVPNWRFEAGVRNGLTRSVGVHQIWNVEGSCEWEPKINAPSVRNNLILPSGWSDRCLLTGDYYKLWHLGGNSTGNLHIADWSAETG